MNSCNPEDFKTQVKAWLKNRGVDYLWLADQCGVSVNTVRNWMAKASIPPLKQKMLRKLIALLPGQLGTALDGSLLEITPTITLNIRMTTDVYDRLVLAAYKRGIDVGSLLNSVLADAAANTEPATQSDTAAALRNRKVVLPGDSEGEAHTSPGV